MWDAPSNSVEQMLPPGTQSVSHRLLSSWRQPGPLTGLRLTSWMKLMLEKLDIYGLIGVVVPGAILLGASALCLVDCVNAAYMAPLPDFIVGVVGVAALFYLGHAIQAVASLVEPILFWTWGGKPSELVLRDASKTTKRIPSDIATRVSAGIRAKYNNASDSAVFLHAMHVCKQQSGARVHLFNSHYAFHRAMLVTLAMTAVLVLGAHLCGNPTLFSLPVTISAEAILVALVALEWGRAKSAAYYYVREVLVEADAALANAGNHKE